MNDTYGEDIWLKLLNETETLWLTTENVGNVGSRAVTVQERLII